MPLPKRQLKGEFECGGIRLLWSLLREQQWCTADGWQGPLIEVAREDGNYRKLHLRYPSRKMKTNLNLTEEKRWTRPDYQYRPLIRERKIKLDTEAAIIAGWDLASRGKTFVFGLDDSPE